MGQSFNVLKNVNYSHLFDLLVLSSRKTTAPKGRLIRNLSVSTQINSILKSKQTEGLLNITM